MTTTRFVAYAVGTAAVHLVVAVGSSFVAFSMGMARFDSGTPPGVIEETAARVSQVLLQPALSMCCSHGVSSLPQWLLIGSNSLLWGLLLSGLLALAARIAHKGEHAAT